MDKNIFMTFLFINHQHKVSTKSIAYYSDDAKLFSGLQEALKPDEWEELKNSRLGGLNCVKKFELWSLRGVKPVRFSLHEFEENIGLNCEYVKYLDHPLVEVTYEMKVFWGQIGMNLEYLAIYASFNETPRTSTSTRASLTRLGRVAFKFLMESIKKLDLTKTYAIEGFVQVLQVWIYNALPEFTAGFGNPLEGKPTPPLLAFLGGKGRKMPRRMYINICWNQTHWPFVGTKLWTYVKVEYQQMKKEAGQVETSKKAKSPSPIESEEESRKKACESLGLDMQTMTADIELWLTLLISNMVEELSRCERAMSTQVFIIESLAEKIGEVEKTVCGGGKEDRTKAGLSGDVFEKDKTVGDKAEMTKLRMIKPRKSSVVSKVQEFLDSHANHDGSDRKLPPGGLDYYTDEDPAYSRYNKTAYWISISKGHIVIWDSDLYTIDFTHERVLETQVPQNKQSGDCGVFCLKYIERHGLGMIFPSHNFCDKKVKAIMTKVGAKILDETSINGTG
ncbi:hypothetical protein N665_0067s0017 [Sinapis alba]|nr:hypothetical protein N665_0067s0017 [Sinapis alba]